MICVRRLVFFFRKQGEKPTGTGNEKRGLLRKLGWPVLPMNPYKPCSLPFSIAFVFLKIHFSVYFEFFSFGEEL